MANREDNTRAGFYYSLALHLSVALGCVLFAYVGLLFASDDLKNEKPFEMVEPPAPSAAVPDSPQETVEDVTENLEPIDVKEIEPLKPIEKIEDPPPTPKPVPKPKPVPEKITFKDFKKTNPRIPQVSRPRKNRPVRVPKIGSSTRNLDRIKTSDYQIDGLAGNSSRMVDALSAYVSYINKLAKQNWVIPDASPSGTAAVVAFRVSKTGSVSGVRIVQSSGVSAFDSSAVAAVSSLSLVPPPDKLSHEVKVKFVAD